MKINKLIFFFLSVLFVFYSCSDKLFAPDEPVPEPEEQYVQIAVDVNVDTTSLSTKTYMTDDGTAGRVKWSATDYITLYARGDYLSGIKSETASQISSDSTKATFVFNVYPYQVTELAGKEFYLYYGKQTLSATVNTTDGSLNFSISLPANQTHAGSTCFNEFENISFGFCRKGTFGTGAIDCNMHNAFGILKVPVALNDGSVDDIRYIRLTDKTVGNYLAGTFDIAVDTLGIPTMEHHPGTGGDSRTIEKYIPSSIKLSDNPYVYFLVPPGTLFGTGGLGLAVYTDKGYYGNKSVTPKSSTASINRSTITKINISSFKKAYYPTPDQYSANSYIFNASAGVDSFSAKYKGNSYQGNGGDVASRSDSIAYNSNYYAEIMWQTKCNGETLLAADVVDSPVYYNGTGGPCISFHKSGAAGNALIALRNPGNKVSVKQLDGTTKSVDEILWSWHVWIGPTPQEVTVTGNGSSFVIMDRNVGALSAVPEGLSQFHGLAYQYGRKDPFMGSRYTTQRGEKYEAYASIYPPEGIWTVGNAASDFNLSVCSPNVRYMGTNEWCDSNTNVGWGSPNGKIDTVYNKSLVDPCPAGWKVISEKNVQSVFGSKPNGEAVTSGDGKAFKLTNTPYVYFPAAGASISTEAIDNVGSVAMVWCATYDNSYSSSDIHYKAYHISFDLSKNPFDYKFTSETMRSTMPVRCEKWTEPTVNGGTGSAQSVRHAEFVEEEEIEVVTIE